MTAPTETTITFTLNQSTALVAASTVPDEGEETPNGYWRAELAPLETISDYRVLGAPPDGSVSCRNQMWFLYQPKVAPGHDGAVTVGRIDRAWIEDGKLMGEGVLDMADPTAREVHRKLQSGFAGTVSVDLDAKPEDVEDRFYNDAGDVVTDFAEADQDSLHKIKYVKKWRLGGATLVPHPAFHEANVQLGEPNEDADTAETGDGEEYVARTPSGAVKESARKAAAKSGHAMRDGSFPINTTDDLRNAIQAIGRAKDPDSAKRHIISRAKALEATNLLPDSWGSSSDDKKSKTASAAPEQTWAEKVATYAHEHNNEPAPACFDDPKLTAPTKVTVTDDGRVYGHVACWGTEHISYPGQGITPPRSQTGYSMFHRHPVRCSDGSRIRAGVLVMGTGHADLTMATSAASAHYDHTGHIVADVRAGEDDHGIWVAGALHPEVTPLQISVLDRYSLSGDWRDGELVAALCVNVPGFPIPDSLAASGELPLETYGEPRQHVDEHGDQHALIAAGVVNPSSSAMVNASAQQLLDELRALKAELQPARLGVEFYRASKKAQLADAQITRAFARINSIRSRDAASLNKKPRGGVLDTDGRATRDGVALGHLDMTNDDLDQAEGMQNLNASDHDLIHAMTGRRPKTPSQEDPDGDGDDDSDETMSAAASKPAPQWSTKAGGVSKHLARVARHVKKRRGHDDATALGVAVSAMKGKCAQHATGGNTKNPMAGQQACSEVGKWEALKHVNATRKTRRKPAPQQQSAPAAPSKRSA